MPLRDDLLNPIPGENPSGANLRYAPVFDKIKEARRADDDAPQGDWQFERKTADYAVVIKLAGEALATKSKDLQVAAWLTEAILRKEGFAGLKAGLELIKGLVENFWDTLYPELDDGDAEMRAAPLEWLGTHMETALRSVPLTRGGANWFQFKESRAVGYEATADTDAKVEARNAAIAEGKMSGEEWDKAVAATPKAFYAEMEATLDGILDAIEILNILGEEKFGDVTPSFGPMRTTVEEIQHTVHGLLQKKREVEPDEGAEAAVSEEEPASAEEAQAAPPAPPGKRKARGDTLTAEPSDTEDAFERVTAVASYLRKNDASSPLPYLLLRGLRWGEVRAAGTEVDANLLDAPPTGARQGLKKAANDSEWQQVLELGESAMGQPCGRGWLDLQRYVFRAAKELGYYQIAAAIRAEVNALLADYPALRQASLLDDTPAANPETQAWLDEIAPAPPAEAAYTPAAMEDATEASWAAPDGGPEIVDANEVAMQAARSGKPQEAIEILSREAMAEKSGRGRFQRRLQLAQLCMTMGYERIAHPILEQLASEIDSRGLEGWEAASTVAQPLALLYRCLEKLDTAPDLKQKVYDRICRLDPLQALACGR